VSDRFFDNQNAAANVVASVLLLLGLALTRPKARAL
jgi:hypothetical protein